jgi:hypothetical protein
MPTRECDWWGKTYTYTRDHSRFDTGVCKVAYWRAKQGMSRPWTLTCVVCGDQFEAMRTDALYCSDAHKSLAYRQRRESGTTRT